MAQTTTKANGQVPAVPSTSNSPVTGNRKKAKRRAKAAEAAARQAEEFHARGLANGNGFAHAGHEQDEYEDDFEIDEKIRFDDLMADDLDMYSGEPIVGTYDSPNGYRQPPTSSDSSKKKKRRGHQNDPPEQSHNLPSLAPSLTIPMTMSKEKIWNTSSQEERERIKAFWLSLGEEDRKNLVRVEKDAVLKKMKEQQRHSCSCTVCGRKRIAIEEELEVLYDAYYEELEHYANKQGSGPPPMLSGSRRFGQISGLQPPNKIPPSFNGQRPHRGRITEHFDDEDDEEEEEEAEEEDDDEYSDDLDGLDEDYSEEEAAQFPPSHASDFFNFGQSLTVQGGILTVADDLLKNDGKKFIEMMEQLAERRMAREEDARDQFSNGYVHASFKIPPHSHSHVGHNHPPVPEDEEEYDSQEEEDEYEDDEEDYDDEEMETMTEEQRMEEGRRMFQIFAARMFEQRVLSAYKEKVAAERQSKLIQEEDEEAQNAEAKKAKKARDAAKKKEKAQAKKAALAEEKSKRDAEKAAQEAALREAEAKKVEEQRVRAEEKRRKRETHRKAEEEEKLRKENERQKRLQEQRDREVELQRKTKEAKDRERREKEEVRQREKEARECETREKKEKAEQERKATVEAKLRADRTQKDLHRSHDQPPPAVPTQIVKRPKQQATVLLPPGLQTQHSFSSPQSVVITPVIPKIPIAQRQPSTSLAELPPIAPTSQVGSNTSSRTSPHPTTPQHNSPVPTQQGRTPSQPFFHHPQATSPLHASTKHSPFQQGPFSAMPPMGLNGFPPSMPINPPFGGRMHHDPMLAHQQQFRPMGGPNGMPFPGVSLPIQQGRGFPIPNGPPGFHGPVPQGMMNFGIHPEGSRGLHSRQQSASQDKSGFENDSTANLPRMAPIGRPSSGSGQRQNSNGQLNRNDVDDLSNHLGSSALLEDSDKPLSTPSQARRASAAPGSMPRPGFPPPLSYGMEPSAFSTGLGYGGAGWGAPSHAVNPFGASSLPVSSYMGGWPNPGNFSALNGPPLSLATRGSQPRSVAVRLMLCSACRILEGSSPSGFHLIAAVRSQIEAMNTYQEYGVISDKELLDLCETEGSAHNGGGIFFVKSDLGEGTLIRYEPDDQGLGRPVGPPGEIGSPIVGPRTVRGFSSLAGGIGQGPGQIGQRPPGLTSHETY